MHIFTQLVLPIKCNGTQGLSKFLGLIKTAILTKLLQLVPFLLKYFKLNFYISTGTAAELKKFIGKA